MQTTEGLRETKRRRTKRALQFAALDLLHEGGPEAVTVSQVTKLAGVSDRTFFNYFPDKTSVLIGMAPVLPDTLVLDEFADNPAPLLESAVQMFQSVLDHADIDWELMHRRRIVFEAYPQLQEEGLALAYRLEQQIIHAVARRFSRSVEEDREAENISERASLAGIVIVAAVRHAWREWLSAPLAAIDTRLDLGLRISAALMAVPNVLMDVSLVVKRV